MKIVKDCPCGQTHRVSDLMWRKISDATRGKADTVPVGNVHGCWRIPRIYIAMHGVKADELATLAERYSWERV